MEGCSDGDKDPNRVVNSSDKEEKEVLLKDCANKKK